MILLPTDDIWGQNFVFMQQYTRGYIYENFINTYISPDNHIFT